MKDSMKKIGKVILYIAVVKIILIVTGLAAFFAYKHFHKTEEVEEVNGEEEEEI